LTLISKPRNQKIRSGHTSITKNNKFLSSIHVQKWTSRWCHPFKKIQYNLKILSETVTVGPVLRDLLISSDIEKKTISTIEMSEILSSSRKLQSSFNRKKTQGKTMPFQNSQLSPGTSQCSISRDTNYAEDDEPSKQHQHEAKARFLIPHSAKYLAGYFLVIS
jgi:hypothetical protein